MKTGDLRLLLTGAAVLAACSDAPNGPGPDPEPLTFTFYASHERITTPGHITFTASSDKPFARVEVYESGQKVGESLGPNHLHNVEIVVTRASNGARTYVAKGYDAAGAVGTSDPVLVDVDIRWDSFRVLEGGGGLLVVFDATGALYSAGNSGVFPQQDVGLTKHDVNGRQLWRRTFGGPGWESPASIGVDPSGRVHVAGSIYYPETGKSDCFLVVYEASGNIAWAQQGATPFSESSCAAASDAAGNFYLAGLLAPSLTRSTLFLAKFDASGNLDWVREHERAPGEKSPVPSSVAVDPLGAVYVCGYVWVIGTPADSFVMKFDAEGNRLWTREYGGADRDVPTGLTPDPDGGVYMAGFTERGSDVLEAGNSFLVRFAPDGTLVWDRLLDGGNFDAARGVAADRSAVFLVGQTAPGIRSPDLNEPRQGPYDAFLAKLSRSGELLWIRLLGGRNGEGGFTGANGTNGLGLGLGTNGDVSILVTTRSLATVPEGGFVLARHREVTP